MRLCCISDWISSEPHTLLTGLVFGESPRWHAGRLWLSDWGAREVIAVDLEARREVIFSMPSYVDYDAVSQPGTSAPFRAMGT
jgi:sugar lactone lactonase YvrE